MDIGNVDTAQAVASLRRTVARVVSLIAAVEHPDRAALGVWSTAQVAVHLAHAWELLGAMASTEGGSAPLHEVGELAGLTRSLVTAEGSADTQEVAARIEAAAAGFFAYFETHAEEPRRAWLVEGISASPATFACHLLSESLVHGHDIARAESVPWPISSADAALAIFGFILPQVAQLDPRAMVMQENARGLQACFEVRVRRAGSVVLLFDDGMLTVDPRPRPRVDCHLSVDAGALFLVMWNRTGQWPAVLRGRLVAWGRRPLLGLRLRSLLRNP